MQQISPEPDPTQPPLYEFTNGIPVVGDTLGEVRDAIDDLDPDIIGDFAFRTLLVLNGGRFKRNADQIIAQQRQEEVYAQVRKIAEEKGGDLPGFSDLMVDLYRFIVPRFVAIQQRVIEEHMRPIADTDPES